MGLTLEEFLSQESSVGQQQSKGQFTIDFQVALDKLRAYQLADPTFYLLKLVQSAAVIGGRSLVLALGRDTVEFSFEVDEPGRYGELGRLVRGLSEPPRGHSEMDYLVAGLQASLAKEPREVSWSHFRGTRVEVARCSPRGVQVERRFDGGRQARSSRFRFFLRRRGVGGWLSVLRLFRRERLQEYKGVLERLYGLPTDLRLDGRDLERLQPTGNQIVYQQAPRRALEVGFLVALPPGDNGHCRVLNTRGRPVETPLVGELLRCGRVLSVGGKGRSRVRWIKDGVEVACTEHPELQRKYGAFQAWFGGSQVKTDLSGFQVVQDARWSRELEQIEELLSVLD